MSETETNQQQLGASIAVLGGGSALTAASTAIDSGASTLMSIAGAIMIIAGAILLGGTMKAMKDSKAELDSADRE